MESRSELASAKANAGLKADLYVQFGLSQTGNKLADTYRDPLKQQYASIGISLPIPTGDGVKDEYGWPGLTSTW